MKVNCLFCNSIIEMDGRHDQYQCKRCKAWALVNDDYPSDLDFKQLKKENKLRKTMIDDNELLMYYQFTNQELLQVLTKKQLESLLKVLNNENLETADRNRLHLMRKKVDKYKQLLKQIKFIENFEYPE